MRPGAARPQVVHRACEGSVIALSRNVNQLRPALTGRGAFICGLAHRLRRLVPVTAGSAFTRGRSLNVGPTRAASAALLSTPAELHAIDRSSARDHSSMISRRFHRARYSDSDSAVITPPALALLAGHIANPLGPIRRYRSVSDVR
jgi:hypothetical protein